MMTRGVSEPPLLAGFSVRSFSLSSASKSLCRLLRTKGDSASPSPSYRGGWGQVEQSLASYEALGGTFLPLALAEVRNLRAFLETGRTKSALRPVFVRSSLDFFGHIGSLPTLSGCTGCHDSVHG